MTMANFLRDAFRFRSLRDEAAASGKAASTPPQRAVEPVRAELIGPDQDLIVRYCLVGIFTILVIAALYLAKSVAMPITAGVIFGLILGPATDRLVKVGLPQGLAAAVVVLLGMLLAVLLAAALAAPLAIWSDQLPRIVEALRLRLSGLMAMFEDMAQLTEGLGAPRARMTVEVAEGSPLVSIAVNSSAALGGLLIFFGTLYFYLSSRRAFRARALRLCLGREARQLAGEFLDEIERRVAAYFGVVAIINLSMGAVTGLIAFATGLPMPALWAFGGFLFNFVAYLGPALMTALLLGAGLVQNPDSLFALVPALAYLVLNGIEGNALTPLAVGRWLTVAPFVVFVSIVFWLWLWGPIGAILATPLVLIGTATIEVIGSYRKVMEQAEPPKEQAALVAVAVKPAS